MDKKQNSRRVDVTRLVDGDPDAFRILVRQYGPTVRAWLAGHVSDAETVNDLAQETFIAAWEGLSRYQDDGKLAGWLVGIARNRLRMHFRSTSRRNSAMSKYQESLLALLGGEGAEAGDARLVALSGCLVKLPERTAAVVKARYAEGRSIRDLADRFEMNGNAVTQLLFRARQKLQVCVKQEGAW